MEQEREYFVLCRDNCRFPAMTKEEIVSAINSATGNTGNIDIDSAFITKIKEMNASNNLQFWVGTTAEYNAITEKAQNTLYLLTDDNGFDPNAIINSINELNEKTDNLATKDNALESTINANKTETDSEITKIKDGRTTVREATYSTYFAKHIWMDYTDTPCYKGVTYELFYYIVGPDGEARSLLFSIPDNLPSLPTTIRIFENDKISIYLQGLTDGTYKIVHNNPTNLNQFKRRVVGGVSQ